MYAKSEVFIPEFLFLIQEIIAFIFSCISSWRLLCIIENIPGASASGNCKLGSLDKPSHSEDLQKLDKF